MKIDALPDSPSAPVLFTVEEERRLLWVANQLVEFLREEEVPAGEGLPAMLMLVHQHIMSVPEHARSGLMLMSLNVLAGNYEVCVETGAMQ